MQKIVNGELVDMSPAEIAALAAEQDAEPSAEQRLASARKARVAAAWAAMQSRLESFAAPVAVGGTVHLFGADAESRENIMGVNTAIAVGLPVPDPRPWTPKGSVQPVLCSHAELAAIGGALLAAKDAFMVAYFTHKAAILGLASIEAVAAYDLDTGWPG